MADTGNTGSSLNGNGNATNATSPPSEGVLSTGSAPNSSVSTSTVASTNVTNVTSVISNPTIIENGNWKFLIMDSPTNQNVQAYVKMLQKKNVVAVVRACDPSYSDEPLKTAGIKVMNLPFSDGDPPPAQVVSKWLDFVEDELGAPNKSSTPGKKAASKNEKKKGKYTPADHDERKAIAVHCVAGLVRAPVLVCIALVESGMDPYDAISYIRKRRRGAINARQLQYIEVYKARHGGAKCCSGCSIS